MVLEQRTLLDAKQDTIDEQAERIALLEEWKRLITSQRFASKSEKTPPEQGHLFNEAEVLATEALGDEDPGELIVPEHKRRKAGRRPLPDHLPVREILHDLSEDQKICPHDPTHRLSEIGRESSDQLNFIPARCEIIRYVRPKYACATCKEGVRIAPIPLCQRS